MNNALVSDFVSWVDRVMLEHGKGKRSVAYNFNLYEHEDEFAIQLIGATKFDVTDPDWPCYEAFSSGEDLFILPYSVVGRKYETGQRKAKALIKAYLERGKEAERLKRSRGVALGFVGGDLELVYLGERNGRDK
jgi:cupin superfamily acireductone dioxygenase involved in methionine salvage